MGGPEYAEHRIRTTYCVIGLVSENIWKYFEKKWLLNQGGGLVECPSCGDFLASRIYAHFVFKEHRYSMVSHFILQVGCIHMYVSACILVSVSPLS